MLPEKIRHTCLNFIVEHKLLFNCCATAFYVYFILTVLYFVCCSTNHMLICCDLARSLLDIADRLKLRHFGIDLLCKDLKIMFSFIILFCVLKLRYHRSYRNQNLMQHHVKRKFNFPNNCPSCGGKTVKDYNEITKIEAAPL